jgi:hypothetical protein
MSLAHHSTLCRAAPAFSSTTNRRLPVLCCSVRQHAASQPTQQQDQQHLQQQTRRALLSQAAAAAAGLLLLRAPTASAAGPLDNIARQLTRPDITPLGVRQQQIWGQYCSCNSCSDFTCTAHGVFGIRKSACNVEVERVASSPTFPKLQYCSCCEYITPLQVRLHVSLLAGWLGTHHWWFESGHPLWLDPLANNTCHLLID